MTSREEPAPEPGDTLDPASRPRQIAAGHLAKLALVYVRQSSPEQVSENTGSTDDQRTLVQVARRWGWPESRTRLIDHDLGFSGTTADRRSGFQTMLDLIDQGMVGLVLVREVARLSREPLYAEIFLNKAIRAGVLIYANGRVFDSATDDLAELFGLRVQALLAWYENRTRARIMGNAKAARVRQGFAVAGRPVGYIRISRGKWSKDPDPEVQSSIQRVFDLALDGQSIGKIFRHLQEHQLSLPRRLKGGELTWRPPARSSVANILTNPNYTADYYYRRRHGVSKANRHGPQVEFRPASDWLVARDHHEGYVSQEQWQKIQDVLASRRPDVRPPLGKGPAWLQGIVWCGQCDRWMWTSYHRRRGAMRLPSYLCRRGDRARGPAHHIVGAAEVIDDLVATHVLKALAAVDRDAAMAVVARAQAEQRSVRESQHRQLQHAEAEVRTARQRYLDVSPEHPLVRADLESAYEDAIRRRDVIKAAIDADPVEDVAFTPEDGAELMELTQQLEALWDAATTTTEDRKQLLRLVLDRVIVWTSTTEAIDLELVWVGGLRERLQVQRRAELDAQVRTLREHGMPPREIVQALKASGVPSLTGQPASRDIVRRSLKRVGLNRAAVRGRILQRIRALALEGHSRTEIMTVLDQEFPRPRGRPWTHDRLYRAVQRLQAGAPGIDPLPASVLDGPDMTPVRAFVEQARAEGKTWKQVAADLNAAGFRPARAEEFSLFQVMELMRRAARRAHPRGRSGPKHPRGFPHESASHD
jgi:DNA invertase Pin-like site-specific DNA recombinase